VEARRAITIMSKPFPNKTKEVKKEIKSVAKRLPRPFIGLQIKAGHPLHDFMFSRDKKSLVWDMKGGDSAAKKYACSDDYVAVSSPSSAIASSLVDPLAPYQFRLAQALSLNSGTAGAFSFSIEWDPAVVGGSDWTAVTTLFNQVRLVEAHLHLVCVTQQTVSSTFTNVAICSNISAYAGTPSSYTVVLSQPDAKIHGVSTFMSDPTRSIIHSSPRRPNKLWAPVGTPAGAVDTGCYGTFWIAPFATTNMPVSSRILEGYLELIVEVRGRA